jgi:hypothetical protein
MSILGMALRGEVQLPREQWGTEGLPFNDLPASAFDSWDVVEGIAQRLGVNLWHGEDAVHLWLNENNYGTFDNSTGGIELALQFLGGIAAA